jgi:NAD(P)-dependent dehydrogenase (short-subunit alcohol dehydrogenase family)
MEQQMLLDGIDLPLEDYRRQLADQIPQKRWVEAREIGALAAFLCQDDAFGITGQDLTVAAGSLW